ESFIILSPVSGIWIRFASQQGRASRRMIERIKNALADVPRAPASTVHYLYLARIPFLGWVTLFAFPLLAITVGRPLVLAAYDLASSGEAFFVGIRSEEHTSE